MRRFLTLVCLLFLAIPAGITITGCTRNPAGNYCNGSGYGPKVTDLYTITLEPKNTGISLAFGQTRQISSPAATSCKGSSVSVTGYTYGTTNNRLVDISPSGNICAGTWNRNSGGGIADYTICNYPNPLPKTDGLPYSTAYISASAQSVTSNPVEVYVHVPVTSITLVGPSQCLSQTEQAQLDAQACYVANGKQVLMCAPSTVAAANYACPLPTGVTSVPSCTSSIGALSYNVATAGVASINSETNQITALMPGTTAITASVAGSGSSAGYFSVCPPASIAVTLNGKENVTVTQGVTQNMVTAVLDTNSKPINGLTLDYQSTNPLNITASGSGAVNAAFPGSAALYAVCQPGTCNPAPINQIGTFGTGLSISSNPVQVTVPGTASAYVWYGAPGQSQYFVPVQLLTGTVGSTVRLPYVPNSMVMDRAGANIYFGSSHELIVFSTLSNSRAGEYPSLPGVVLAVSPNGSQILVNDQVRNIFYLATSSGVASASFGGLGTSAYWTPDGKTLYVTDSYAAGGGHTDTMYVYNANTGWTTHPLPCSAGNTKNCVANGNASTGALGLAVTVPSVGAYASGNPTVAHTWCPSGNPTNYSTMDFYPEGDSVNTNTEVLAATADGMHILGAAAQGSLGPISFSDIGVAIPSTECPRLASGALLPLTIDHTLNHATVNVEATAVNAIVTSPAAVKQGVNTPGNSLSFVLYNGTTAGATLPYYVQATTNTSSAGTVGYLTLTGGSEVTAPVAGAFSPDNTLFFVSTSGDNKIHYIDTGTLKDTQQISPNLPACTPASDSDPDCKIRGTVPSVVPATSIWVKPRATT
jgi:trimeric autotransporter adhesin